MHLGDFGQSALRPEQRDAIGETDVAFVPVGGGPTIDGEQAARIVAELRPRLVVPMHYATDAVDFLEPADRFLSAVDGRVERLSTSEAGTAELMTGPARPWSLCRRPRREAGVYPGVEGGAPVRSRVPR